MFEAEECKNRKRKAKGKGWTEAVRRAGKDQTKDKWR